MHYAAYEYRYIFQHILRMTRLHKKYQKNNMLLTDTKVCVRTIEERLDKIRYYNRRKYF